MREFALKLKDVNGIIRRDEGIGPVNRFADKSRVLSVVNCPRKVGNVPLRRFPGTLK